MCVSRYTLVVLMSLVQLVTYHDDLAYAIAGATCVLIVEWLLRTPNVRAFDFDKAAAWLGVELNTVWLYV